VFKSFNFDVPRSSCEYDNVGEKISLEDAKPGDIILFKGTKSHHPHSIGHVGIVYSNIDGEVKFIHSTSGKEYCVTISAMDDTYKRRFVQVVRLLKQNDAAPVLAAQ
jgi:lipoprotein Spr